MKLLVIDNDAEVVDLVESTSGLVWPGTTTVFASSGSAGIKAVDSEAPKLVVLEVDLPDLDGFSVCRQIRQHSDVPIIMLSNRDKEADIIQGLDVGADDYLVKPLDPIVFISRVNAVLRRAYPQPSAENRCFKYGDLEIDFARAKVTLDERAVDLTYTEYQLLIQLVKNTGQIVPSLTLIDLVWGRKSLVDIPCLKVYIARLRNKLGEDVATPKYIITERARGYGFAKGQRRDSPSIIQDSSDNEDGSGWSELSRI